MDVRLARWGTLVFGIAVLPVHAEWIKLSTPHFEMYTTNTRARAMEALEIFEEARCFFDENSPSQTVTDGPIRVVAFESEAEFRPYRTIPGAVAFYEHGHGRDYIVMRDLGPGSSSVAIHEYAHLYFEHHNIRLPLWLNEGLADVYSTLERRGMRVIIGSPPPGRLEAVRARPLVDLHQLMAVDQRSPYYRDPRHMEQFYAESWALAHMLLIGEKYRGNCARFLAMVQTNGADASFRVVYRKSLNDVSADLREYVSQGEMEAASFEAHLDRSETPTVSEFALRDAELVLADLLSTGYDTTAEGRARLRELEAESPKNPELQRALGYVAWHEGKIEEAKQHFGEAVQEGSRDALMIFQYAGLLHASSAPSEQVIHLLERAVELKPDFDDARYDLGMEAASQGQCEVALSALSPLETITSDRAYPLYSVLAYCTWKQGNTAGALHWADLAKHYATNANESASAGQLLGQLDRMQR